MNIDISRHEHSLTLTLQGRIEELEAETLKQRFRENRLDGIQETILDLGQVTHIGRSGIGKLILIYKDITFQSGKPKIIKTPPGIYDKLKKLSLIKFFLFQKFITNNLSHGIV